jgi:IS605 OrfB family transposase
MRTLQCLLEFQDREDKEKVLDLMRRYSSAERYAYQRLVEGWERKELKKHLAGLFQINTRYADDAIKKAESTLRALKELGKNPKRVIFGGRELFQKLKRKHLNGGRYFRLKAKWKEKRQGSLYSRGDKSKQGNLNLRFVWMGEELYLRINAGARVWIYAKVVRKVSRERDKWIDFIADLLTVKITGNYYPYNVELKLRDGEIYAYVSIEEKYPRVSITKANGVIGIDVNASPFHLALAEVSRDGNLIGYERISFNEFIGANSQKRVYLSWQIAYRVVETAKKGGKAIAIENLQKLPKGKRGDGMTKLRRRLQQWTYKGILDKIEILARRNGIEVVKVDPAYTSVIGRLKYSPQHNIDKDIASAFVIGRRALGFREKLPGNYHLLLKDEEYLLYATQELEERIKELKQKVKKEANEFKRNAIKKRLSTVKRELKLLGKHLKSLKSRESESATQEPVNQRKEQMRGHSGEWQKSWQVLSRALVFPYLEKFPQVKETCRDFSPLRGVLISGDWIRGIRRQVPVLGAGAAVRYSFVQFC